MKIRKLNEEIRKLLCETLEDEAKYIVNSFLTSDYYNLGDVLDEYELSEISGELAEDMNCIVYGENNKDNLVLNVKGRPHITNSEILDYLNDPENSDVYTFAIDSFVTELKNKYPDLIILGRSSGYWGLEDCNSQITLTNDGIDTLIEALIEKAKDYYNRPIGEEELNTAWELFGADLVKDLMTNASINFKFKDEYKNKMLQLIDDIKDKEEQMNHKEYWEI